jgi:hypothetical protein
VAIQEGPLSEGSGQPPSEVRDLHAVGGRNDQWSNALQYLDSEDQ